MGYIRGFIHGAVAGTVLGLCIAPQPGERTRDQLSALGRRVRGGLDSAQRTAKQMAPMVEGAASAARGQVERMQHHAPATPGMAGNGHR